MIFMALALVLGGFFGWMHMNARITHLCPAEVYIRDLPRSFEGTKILYLSDLKLQSTADTTSAKRLMKRLSVLQPDILILGGDYGGNSLLETLNGTENTALAPHVADFIASLGSFPASLGKFAVAGDQDHDLYALATTFQSAGVQCLADSSAMIDRNGETIHIAGLSDRSYGRDGSAKLSRNFKKTDCVITTAHNPASYIDIRVSEANGGGTWSDLVLSGHTLGGQINLAGRSLRPFTEEEKRTFAGWFYANDLPLLVSEGIGCEDVPLRLGSNSQIHLITLHRQEIMY